MCPWCQRQKSCVPEIINAKGICNLEGSATRDDAGMNDLDLVKRVWESGNVFQWDNEVIQNGLVNTRTGALLSDVDVFGALKKRGKARGVKKRKDFKSQLTKLLRKQ